MRYLLVFVVVAFMFAGEIDTLKQNAIKVKNQFFVAKTKYYLQKKQLDKLKDEYELAPNVKEQNILIAKINKQIKKLTDSFKKAKELKDKYNKLTYQIALKKYEKLSKIVQDSSEISSTGKQSCVDLDIKECKAKAYNTTKKNIEKNAKDEIVSRIKNSPIKIDKISIEDAIKTNILSYKDLDNGYFYMIGGRVNANLKVDETELFNIDKITWNEQFEEPEEMEEIPLIVVKESLPIQEPKKEEEVVSVYHSGKFVSFSYSTQSHSYSNGDKESVNGILLSGGFKYNDKDKVYFEIERANDKDGVLNIMSLNYDIAMNLKQIIYPYFGVGYGIANYKASDYKYSGSVYHFRVGSGYEINDHLEFDVSYRYTILHWSVANNNKNIDSLDMGRNIGSFNFRMSYLF